MKFFKKYVEMKEKSDEIKFMQWLITFSVTMGVIMAASEVHPIFAIVGIIAFIGNQFALLDWIK